MARTARRCVVVCMLGATACGFPRPPDIAGDAPSDAQVCFGNDPFKLCFASAPTGAINVSATTTFNNDTGIGDDPRLNCATSTSGGSDYCVIAASTITISARLRAEGRRPLVLVATDSIIVPTSGSIDVSSHRVPAESIGAGADPSTGCPPRRLPTMANGTSGGGAGGSFFGAGSDGGNGGSVPGGFGGNHASAVSEITAVRGGCPGQDGAGASNAPRGHGGGAVFLIAGNVITVDGTINAGGEGGAGGAPIDSGGGGGGSGGMIGFDAPTVLVNGTLIANGGAGGEGGGNSLGGNPGSDAVSTNAATGGANGSTSGGAGGDGSAGAAGGRGGMGLDGTFNGGGGGGGGGGAGLIKGPPASLGTKLSPAATP